ncbi:uncharacterized protein LOC117104115 isoform X1 [Anneissia japonica]|uniref:uncharacterized protein LOC117104115 isoform X1 n=1 Tax=Anneissia japonica TaxID=1529436 RepID=UPI00142573EE|nr:uncharacterized protein LOC117104115 isoform X1 [Anneissia japonica]
MGSSPSQVGTIKQEETINVAKKITEDNSKKTTTTKMSTETDVSSENYASNRKRPTVEHKHWDEWDDVATEMSNLKDELDELLGMPSPVNMKKNVNVPEPLTYPAKSSPAKPMKKELGKGNTWKMPEELVERELNARHMRILNKMKELMIACEDEDIDDTSPWIQSMCSDSPDEAMEPKLPRQDQLKEDTSRFDPKKFKQANIYNKRTNDFETLSSSTTNRTGGTRSSKTPTSSSVESKPPCRSELEYNSSEEALMKSIENEYS